MSVALPSTPREGAVASQQACHSAFQVCLYIGLSCPLVVSSQVGSGSAKLWVSYFILLPQAHVRYDFLYVFCSEQFWKAPLEET